MGIAIPQVITDRSGAQVIDASLRFDSDKDTHLKYIPGNSGSFTTFTWSCWVKRHKNFGTRQHLFGQSSDGNNEHYIAFDTDNTLFVSLYQSATHAYVPTNAVFRDTEWYHIVWLNDTTQATASDRIKLYVNGVQQSIDESGGSFTYPTQNRSGRINNAMNTHRIARGSDAYPFPADVSMTNMYFIDGQGLGPENFGFTDPLTNTWKPKKYSGTFTGQNSLYLPMDGNTPAGKDQSNYRNRDWTPVNFGGSMELDNPNVSGARPILNTTQGGTQAAPGVFGSKQNVGYAVTVYNDGGGNK